MNFSIILQLDIVTKTRNYFDRRRFNLRIILAKNYKRLLSTVGRNQYASIGAIEIEINVATGCRHVSADLFTTSRLSRGQMVRDHLAPRS